MATDPIANTQQNTPNASELDRQIALDTKAQEQQVEDAEAKVEALTSELEETEEVKEATPEETTDEEEHDQKDTDTKDDDKEEDDKRIARLAYERREAQKQLRAAQEELARLKGQKPENADEDFNRRVQEQADKIYQQRVFAEKCEKVRDQGLKDFPDFKETLNSFSEVTQGGLVQPVIEALLETDAPTKVINYLGKHLHEYEHLLELPPIRMAAAVSKLAAKINVPPPPKPQSKAPAPIKPINGGGVANKDPEKMSIADYMKMEDERELKRRFK